MSVPEARTDGSGDPLALPLWATPEARPPIHSLGSTPTVAMQPAQSGQPVDWGLVASLRARASDQLSQATSTDRGRLDRSAQEELGRSIVLDLVEAAMAEAVNDGAPAWSLHQQDQLARAVFDALFRLGRLQPLVDDDRVEN